MMNQPILQPYCLITSPAKAILSGQHAVVYGKDAIAIGIGLYCQGELRRKPSNAKNAMLSIHSSISPPLAIDGGMMELLRMKHQGQERYTYERFQQDLKQSGHALISQHHFENSIHFKLSLFLHQQHINYQQWQQDSSFDYFLQISSNIPIGKCLGSSAAFNTVLSTALLIVFHQMAPGMPLTPELKEKINAISIQFQAVEHGTPSGIDNYISVHGGVILYNKTKEPRFTELPHAAKHLKDLMNIGVVDSGIEKNTKIAVGNVRNKVESSQQYKAMIEEIGSIAREMAAIMEDSECNSNSIERLLKLAQKNHQLLRELGVSHAKIEQIVNEWKEKGWIGKITGSGMGGCVLLLALKSTPLHEGIVLAQLDQTGLQVTLL